MFDQARITQRATSIAHVMLVPAMRHTDDVTHMHVLQDALQKIRRPYYHAHPDFETGYSYGQQYYQVHDRACSFPPHQVIALICGHLAHQDHDDLNTFYQVIGCQTTDYAYRVGFVFGWLMALVEAGKVPVYPTFTQIA